MKKNSSRISTVGLDKYSYSGLAMNRQEKLVFTLLSCVLVGIAYFLLTGCSPTAPSSPMKNSWSTYSDSVPQDSSGTVALPLSDFPVNQESAEPASEPEPSTKPAPVHLASLELNPKRLVVLSGVIDSHVLEKASQLYSLAEDSKQPIDILIASPGGYIDQGLYFIQAMKAIEDKGITVRCVVSNLAASMAYVIFTQCTERYALPYSQLLFHPPRIQTSGLFTPAIAAQLFKGLKTIENVLVMLMVPVMGVSQSVGGEWFVKNYLDERLFTGQELAQESPIQWFQVVDHVDGVADLFPNPYGGSGLSSEKRNQIIYIKEKP